MRDVPFPLYTLHGRILDKEEDDAADTSSVLPLPSLHISMF